MANFIPHDIIMCDDKDPHGLTTQTKIARKQNSL